MLINCFALKQKSFSTIHSPPHAAHAPSLHAGLQTRNVSFGILNWALEGLRQWQRHGLMVPKKIEVATAAYRDEMDIIGEWVGDHCETGAGCTVNKSEAYKAYRSWALDNGHHPLAQGRLTRRLNERGYKVQADKRTIGGLRLNKAGEFATLRLI